VKRAPCPSGSTISSAANQGQLYEDLRGSPLEPWPSGLNKEEAGAAEKAMCEFSRNMAGATWGCRQTVKPSVALDVHTDSGSPTGRAARGEPFVRCGLDASVGWSG
jgi:hypothetical protein